MRWVAPRCSCSLVTLLATRPAAPTLHERPSADHDRLGAARAGAIIVALLRQPVAGVSRFATINGGPCSSALEAVTPPDRGDPVSCYLWPMVFSANSARGAMCRRSALLWYDSGRAVSVSARTIHR